MLGGRGHRGRGAGGAAGGLGPGGLPGSPSRHRPSLPTRITFPPCSSLHSDPCTPLHPPLKVSSFRPDPYMSPTPPLSGPPPLCTLTLHAPSGWAAGDAGPARLRAGRTFGEGEKASRCLPPAQYPRAPLTTPAGVTWNTGSFTHGFRLVPPHFPHIPS